MADEGSDASKKDDILEDSNADSKADSKVPDETKYDDADKIPTITTTKNALITTQLGPCEAYPHSVKISIVGARKVGMACAIAILMRRIASEVCLIDQNSDKASAEAEDIQHAGIFLGCPLVVGTSVSIWSSVHVAGTKIRDINPQMGEADDPEKWRDISEAVNKTDTELNRKKGEGGPNCWALGFCTAEIIDAIVRNTKVVLPVSTYIHSCAHGTDKDMYMSVPCVLGREGVYATVRQKLNEQEKTAIQRCADSIRDVLRECGILRESSDIEE